MKVALVQFDTLWNAPEQNMATVERLLEGVECDVAILPEMFATSYSTEAALIAEPARGPIISWMERQAQKGGYALIGTVATRERGECYNRMYVCLPDGTTCHYDKHHLFTFAGEQNSFSAGKERIVVEWKGVRILPLVCYDLRFPAWSYLPGQVELIVYSASWAASRISAWDALLPARAIENQAWVVGVGRIGNDKDGTHYVGHSVAYDHLGRRMADCGEREAVEVVEIEPERVAAFRDKFRAWQDADQIVIK